MQIIFIIPILKGLYYYLLMLQLDHYKIKSSFNYLKKYNEFEIGLSNVIFNNLDNDLFYSSIINCKRYDIGNKKGYIKAFNKMSDLK